MEKSSSPPPYSPPQPGFQPPPYVGNPPPPAGFIPPPQQREPQTVIVTHTLAQVPVGPSPTSTTCPSCHAHIITSIEVEASTKTHMFALILFMFGCWPCCCIPYCMDSCQSKTHYCPNCRAFIGKFEL